MNNTIEDNSPLRVALVGCGRIATRHVDALKALSDRIHLVGAADPAAEARRWVEESTSVPTFPSLGEMLARVPVDLVTLATPTGLHPEQAVAAAEAGAHVLTEKPLGTRLDDARQMVSRVDELRRRLFLVKQLRYHPLFLAVRDAVQTGRFGRLHTVSLQVFWCRPQAYYAEASWRGTRKLDGGALTNQASHYVDLLDWLFGPVARVQALGGTLGREIEAEDTAVVSCQWEEGFLGSLHVTMLTYPANLTTCLTVIGERGTVRLGGRACDVVEAWDFDTPAPQDQTIEGLARAVPETLRRGHQAVYEDLVESLRGGVAPAVDGREGLRSLAIIDAAYRSFDTGEPVPVSRFEELP